MNAHPTPNALRRALDYWTRIASTASTHSARLIAQINAAHFAKQLAQLTQ